MQHQDLSIPGLQALLILKVDKMKYVVSGLIKRDNTKFSREVDAKSEKHAKDVVLAFFGSKHKLKRSWIEFSAVEAAKG